jgi:SAM-dependent methyltransferase
VGCGSGKVLRWAKEQNWDVAGVDPSSSAVAAARSQGLLEVDVGAADTLPHPPNSFDCVLMSHSLEHVHHPRTTLREVARVLRPGGYLIVVVPNFESIFRIAVGTRWHALDVPRHLYHFNPVSLRKLAAAEGFINQQMRFASLPSSLILNARSAKNSFGVAGVIAAMPRIVRAILNNITTTNRPEGRLKGDVIWSLWSRRDDYTRPVN